MSERWLDRLDMRTPAVDRLASELRLLEAQCEELKAENARVRQENRELTQAVMTFWEVLVPLTPLGKAVPGPGDAAPPTPSS